MSVGPGVLPNTGHLPGDLHARFAAANLEVISGNFFCDVKIGARCANCSELITEVAVELAEPLRQGDGDFALSVGGYRAVIDILHVRRLDERVVEIFVSRIERVVYLERTTGLRKIAGNLHVT